MTSPQPTSSQTNSQTSSQPTNQTITAYRFIYDEAQVREFHRLHISPFAEQAHLSFLLIPTARKKYWPELSNSQIVLNSEPFSSKCSADSFVRYIRNLEIAEGLYLDGKRFLSQTTDPDANLSTKQSKSKPIPGTAFVIYVSADPLSELRGFFAFQKEISTRLEQMLLQTQNQDPPPAPAPATPVPATPATPDQTTNDSNQKQKQEAPRLSLFSTLKSKIHSSPHKTFVKLDVDTKDPEKISSLRHLMHLHQIVHTFVTETRNGYHVIINKRNGGIKDQAHQALYKFHLSTLLPPPNPKPPNYQKEYWMTIETNAMIAIPGTLQGGYPVHFVQWDQ